MSANRSWDIQPNRRPAKAPGPKREAPAPVRAPRPASRVEPVRVVRPAPKEKEAPIPRQAPLRAAPLPKGNLRDRRKKKRRAARYLLFVIFILITAGAFYGVWRPAFRINDVHASGPDSDVVQEIANASLAGTYWHIIPRNSIFFYPRQRIRKAVLDAEPDIAAVSFTRTSFYSIDIASTPRAISFIWCGTTIDTPYTGGTCFNADIEGLIFSQAADLSGVATTATSAASTSTAMHSQPARSEYVRVFAPLDTQLADGQAPLRTHVANASSVPDALSFVQAMETLGAPVSALALRTDVGEADLWLGGPTRITYVLGHEKEAAELAASALPTLNLKDGSIQYVDLRFGGKAYVKRYGQ